MLILLRKIFKHFINIFIIATIIKNLICNINLHPDFNIISVNNNNSIKNSNNNNIILKFIFNFSYNSIGLKFNQYICFGLTYYNNKNYIYKYIDKVNLEKISYNLNSSSYVTVKEYLIENTYNIYKLTNRETDTNKIINIYTNDNFPLEYAFIRYKDSDVLKQTDSTNDWYMLSIQTTIPVNFYNKSIPYISLFTTNFAFDDISKVIILDRLNYYSGLDFLGILNNENSLIYYNSVNYNADDIIINKEFNSKNIEILNMFDNNKKKIYISNIFSLEIPIVFSKNIISNNSSFIAINQNISLIVKFNTNSNDSILSLIDSNNYQFIVRHNTKSIYKQEGFLLKDIKVQLIKYKDFTNSNNNSNINNNNINNNYNAFKIDNIDFNQINLTNSNLSIVLINAFKAIKSNSVIETTSINQSEIELIILNRNTYTEISKYSNNKVNFIINKKTLKPLFYQQNNFELYEGMTHMLTIHLSYLNIFSIDKQSQELSLKKVKDNLVLKGIIHISPNNNNEVNYSLIASTCNITYKNADLNNIQGNLNKDNNNKFISNTIGSNPICIQADNDSSNINSFYSTNYKNINSNAIIINIKDIEKSLKSDINNNGFYPLELKIEVLAVFNKCESSININNNFIAPSINIKVFDNNHLYLSNSQKNNYDNNNNINLNKLQDYNLVSEHYNLFISNSVCYKTLNISNDNEYLKYNQMFDDITISKNIIPPLIKEHTDFVQYMKRVPVDDNNKEYLSNFNFSSKEVGYLYESKFDNNNSKANSKLLSNEYTNSFFNSLIQITRDKNTFNWSRSFAGPWVDKNYIFRLANAVEYDDSITEYIPHKLMIKLSNRYFSLKELDSKGCNIVWGTNTNITNKDIRISSKQKDYVNNIFANFVVNNNDPEFDSGKQVILKHNSDKFIINQIYDETLNFKGEELLAVSKYVNTPISSDVESLNNAICKNYSFMLDLINQFEINNTNTNIDNSTDDLDIDYNNLSSYKQIKRYPSENKETSLIGITSDCFVYNNKIEDITNIYTPFEYYVNFLNEYDNIIRVNRFFKLYPEGNVFSKNYIYNSINNNNNNNNNINTSNDNVSSNDIEYYNYLNRHFYLHSTSSWMNFDNDINNKDKLNSNNNSICILEVNSIAWINSYDAFNNNKLNVNSIIIFLNNISLLDLNIDDYNNLYPCTPLNNANLNESINIKSSFFVKDDDTIETFNNFLKTDNSNKQDVIRYKDYKFIFNNVLSFGYNSNNLINNSNYDKLVDRNKFNYDIRNSNDYFIYYKSSYKNYLSSNILITGISDNVITTSYQDTKSNYVQNNIIIPIYCPIINSKLNEDINNMNAIGASLIGLNIYYDQINKNNIYESGYKTYFNEIMFIKEENSLSYYSTNYITYFKPVNDIDYDFNSLNGKLKAQFSYQNNISKAFPNILLNTSKFNRSFNDKYNNNLNISFASKPLILNNSNNFFSNNISNSKVIMNIVFSAVFLCDYVNISDDIYKDINSKEYKESNLNYFNYKYKNKGSIIIYENKFNKMILLTTKNKSIIDSSNNITLKENDISLSLKGIYIKEEDLSNLKYSNIYNNNNLEINNKYNLTNSVAVFMIANTSINNKNYNLGYSNLIKHSNLINKHAFVVNFPNINLKPIENNFNISIKHLEIQYKNFNNSCFDFKLSFPFLPINSSIIFSSNNFNKSTIGGIHINNTNEGIKYYNDCYTLDNLDILCEINENSKFENNIHNIHKEKNFCFCNYSLNSNNIIMLESIKVVINNKTQESKEEIYIWNNINNNNNDININKYSISKLNIKNMQNPYIINLCFSNKQIDSISNLFINISIGANVFRGMIIRLESDSFLDLLFLKQSDLLYNYCEVFLHDNSIELCDNSFNMSIKDNIKKEYSNIYNNNDMIEYCIVYNNTSKNNKIIEIKIKNEILSNDLLRSNVEDLTIKLANIIFIDYKTLSNPVINLSIFNSLNELILSNKILGVENYNNLNNINTKSIINKYVGSLIGLNPNVIGFSNKFVFQFLILKSFESYINTEDKDNFTSLEEILDNTYNSDINQIKIHLPLKYFIVNNTANSAVNKKNNSFKNLITNYIFCKGEDKHKNLIRNCYFISNNNEIIITINLSFNIFVYLKDKFKESLLNIEIYNLKANYLLNINEIDILTELNYYNNNNNQTLNIIYGMIKNKNIIMNKNNKLLSENNNIIQNNMLLIDNYQNNNNILNKKSDIYIVNIYDTKLFSENMIIINDLNYLKSLLEIKLSLNTVSLLSLIDNNNKHLNNQENDNNDFNLNVLNHSVLTSISKGPFTIHIQLTNNFYLIDKSINIDTIEVKIEEYVYEDITSEEYYNNYKNYNKHNQLNINDILDNSIIPFDLDIIINNTNDLDYSNFNLLYNKDSSLIKKLKKIHYISGKLDKSSITNNSFSILIDNSNIILHKYHAYFKIKIKNLVSSPIHEGQGYVTNFFMTNSNYSLILKSSLNLSSFITEENNYFKEDFKFDDNILAYNKGLYYSDISIDSNSIIKNKFVFLFRSIISSTEYMKYSDYNLDSSIVNSYEINSNQIDDIYTSNNNKMIKYININSVDIIKGKYTRGILKLLKMNILNNYVSNKYLTYKYLKQFIKRNIENYEENKIISTEDNTNDFNGIIDIVLNTIENIDLSSGNKNSNIIKFNISKDNFIDIYIGAGCSSLEGIYFVKPTITVGNNNNNNNKDSNSYITKIISSLLISEMPYIKVSIIDSSYNKGKILLSTISNPSFISNLYQLQSFEYLKPLNNTNSMFDFVLNSNIDNYNDNENIVYNLLNNNKEYALFFNFDYEQNNSILLYVLLDEPTFDDIVLHVSIYSEDYKINNQRFLNIDNPIFIKEVVIPKYYYFNSKLINLNNIAIPIWLKKEHFNINKNKENNNNIKVVVKINNNNINTCYDLLLSQIIISNSTINNRAKKAIQISDNLNYSVDNLLLFKYENNLNLYNKINLNSLKIKLNNSVINNNMPNRYLICQLICTDKNYLDNNFISDKDLSNIDTFNRSISKYNTKEYYSELFDYNNLNKLNNSYFQMSINSINNLLFDYYVNFNTLVRTLDYKFKCLLTTKMFNNQNKEEFKIYKEDKQLITSKAYDFKEMNLNINKITNDNQCIEFVFDYSKLKEYEVNYMIKNILNDVNKTNDNTNKFYYYSISDINLLLKVSFIEELIQSRIQLMLEENYNNILDNEDYLNDYKNKIFKKTNMSYYNNGCLSVYNKIGKAISGYNIITDKFKCLNKNYNENSKFETNLNSNIKQDIVNMLKKDNNHSSMNIMTDNISKIITFNYCIFQYQLCPTDSINHNTVINDLINKFKNGKNLSLLLGLNTLNNYNNVTQLQKNDEEQTQLNNDNNILYYNNTYIEGLIDINLYNNYNIPSSEDLLIKDNSVFYNQGRVNFKAKSKHKNKSLLCYYTLLSDYKINLLSNKIADKESESSKNKKTKDNIYTSIDISVEDILNCLNNKPYNITIIDNSTPLNSTKTSFNSSEVYNYNLCGSFIATSIEKTILSDIVKINLKNYNVYDVWFTCKNNMFNVFEFSKPFKYSFLYNNEDVVNANNNNTDISNNQFDNFFKQLVGYVEMSELIDSTIAISIAYRLIFNMTNITLVLIYIFIICFY